MPRYNYICSDCIAAREKEVGRPLTEDEQQEIVFEVSHSIIFPAGKKTARADTVPTMRQPQYAHYTIGDGSEHSHSRW